MENCNSLLLSVTNITEAEEFIRNNCHVDSVEDILQNSLQDWASEWNDFNDIATDIHTRIIEAYESLYETYTGGDFPQGIQIAFECLLLNKLHDFIIPLLYYEYAEKDKSFYDKCKNLCDLNVTAEQLGAPEDYAIPLAAAVVEFASLDVYKNPTEKIHCLCTTFDLVFAELKSAIVEIISASSDENKIPIVENDDILPILMIVIIRSKLIHINANMHYIESFLWKLQEFEHIRNIIGIFKNAVAQIESINEENLRPSSGRVRKDLDLAEVTNIMTVMEVSSKNQTTTQTESLVENYNKRFTDLIVTSTSNIL